MISSKVWLATKPSASAGIGKRIRILPESSTWSTWVSRSATGSSRWCRRARRSSSRPQPAASRPLAVSWITGVLRRRPKIATPLGLSPPSGGRRTARVSVPPPSRRRRRPVCGGVALAGARVVVIAAEGAGGEQDDHEDQDAGAEQGGDQRALVGGEGGRGRRGGPATARCRPTASARSPPDGRCARRNVALPSRRRGSRGGRRPGQGFAAAPRACGRVPRCRDRTAGGVRRPRARSGLPAPRGSRSAQPARPDRRRRSRSVRGVPGGEPSRYPCRAGRRCPHMTGPARGGAGAGRAVLRSGPRGETT